MWEIFQSARLRRLFLAQTVLLFVVAVLSVRLRIGAGYPGMPVGVELWAYWQEALLAGVVVPVSVYCKNGSVNRREAALSQVRSAALT